MDKKTVQMALLFIAIGAAVGWGATWLQKPRNYEECVLKNINDAESDTAARLVGIACGRQFPEAENRFRQFQEGQ